MTTTIKTVWEARTYWVDGNVHDGYTINDTNSIFSVRLSIPVSTHNVGTDAEFSSATPTDKQLRNVFGVRCRIDTDGDDTTIYVNRERDGYPIGELHCESHESLSPIRHAV